MPSSRPPAPLLLAVGLLLLQALALLGCAVGVLLDLGGGLAGGIPTFVMLLVAGLGVGACAWGLLGLGSWARAPGVLAQLIALGIAWDVRGGETWLVLVLVVPALLVLVGIFHPASLRALESEHSDHPGHPGV